MSLTIEEHGAADRSTRTGSWPRKAGIQITIAGAGLGRGRRMTCPLVRGPVDF